MSSDGSTPGEIVVLVRPRYADYRPVMGKEGRKPGLPVLGQPPPAPEERADAARNRARILDAARRLMAQKPISEVCMDEVAAEAGVGKGTLYRRFADRAALCHALLDSEAVVLQQRVLAGFDLPADSPWLLRLDHLFDALIDFTSKNAMLLSEAHAFERERDRFEHPAHHWQRQTVSLYLRQAVAAGELGPLEYETTADFLLAPIDPDLLRFHLERGRSLNELKVHFRAFARSAIGARPPLHRL